MPEITATVEQLRQLVEIFAEDLHYKSWRERRDTIERLSRVNPDLHILVVNQLRKLGTPGV
jgi:hypothetical protein